MADRLFIVIPAYNEQDNIKQVVTEWYPIVEKHGNDSRLVVIDDGSTDDTFAILRKMTQSMPQLTALTKPNGGHGATVMYGYKYALDNGADYVFQTDSDGQTLPSEFGPFWEDRKLYDALIGHRNHREDGFSRIFVTKVLKLVIKLTFGVTVTDANTPYRLMPRKTLEKYLPKIPKDFFLSNVLLSVLLVKNKDNVKFIPITFRPRQGGKNSINMKRIFKIGWQALKDFRQLRKTI